MMEWDDEIAALDLGEFEKNGLQVFKNYKRAFEDRAEKIFSEKVDNSFYSPANFEKIIHLVESEDVRILPNLFCAYVDESLGTMFLKQLPPDVPGGKKALLTGFGPLKDLSGRVKFSFAFGMMSKDICASIDRLRELRNKISHSWDADEFKSYIERHADELLFDIENLLANEIQNEESVQQKLEPETIFRARIIWLLARVEYEALHFAEAYKNQLEPQKALYGQNHPKRLNTISKIAMSASQRIAASSA